MPVMAVAPVSPGGAADAAAVAAAAAAAAGGGEREVGGAPDAPAPAPVVALPTVAKQDSSNATEGMEGFSHLWLLSLDATGGGDGGGEGEDHVGGTSDPPPSLSPRPLPADACVPAVGRVSSAAATSPPRGHWRLHLTLVSLVRLRTDASFVIALWSADVWCGGGVAAGTVADRVILGVEPYLPVLQGVAARGGRRGAGGTFSGGGAAGVRARAATVLPPPPRTGGEGRPPSPPRARLRAPLPPLSRTAVRRRGNGVLCGNRGDAARRTRGYRVLSTTAARRARRRSRHRPRRAACGPFFTSRARRCPHVPAAAARPAACRSLAHVAPGFCAP